MTKRTHFLSLKVDLSERGKPCDDCPWPNGPEITHTVQLAARMGSWFACHGRGGGTCFGALAVTKAYYNHRELEMSNKTRRKNEQRREYRTNPLADAHRRIRGEAPPQYPDADTMLASLAKAHGYSEEHIKSALDRRARELRETIDRANARLEPKITTRQPGATDYSRLPVRNRPSGDPVDAVYYGRTRAAAQRQEEPRIEISEAELTAANEEARAAGRTDLTLEELSRLLALPHVANYSAQRGYLRK